MLKGIKGYIVSVIAVRESGLGAIHQAQIVFSSQGSCLGIIYWAYQHFCLYITCWSQVSIDIKGSSLLVVSCLSLCNNKKVLRVRGYTSSSKSVSIFFSPVMGIETSL